MARYVKNVPYNVAAVYNADMTDGKVDFIHDQLEGKVKDYKYEVTNVLPVISGASDFAVTEGDEAPDYLDGVTALDEQEGDITDRITVDDSDVDLDTAGTYDIIYSVEDSSGNEATETVEIVVSAA